MIAFISPPDMPGKVRRFKEGRVVWLDGPRRSLIGRILKRLSEVFYNRRPMQIRRGSQTATIRAADLSRRR
jgi:hypothetical protein